jgi:hypothetical protein
MDKMSAKYHNEVLVDIFRIGKTRIPRMRKNHSNLSDGALLDNSKKGI